MADVRAICAIGQSGQLGLNGHLPWEGYEGRPFVEDVERFFDITRGHVLIAGPTTIGAVPDFARRDRTLVVIRSHEDPEEVLARFSERVVFVGGGPRVWDVYARYIRHWDINRMPYDGVADRWFDPAWLIAGGTAPRR
ncbi:diacylglycerol kinase [Aureimonas sp. Leaf454]|uniref:dihydrofolate reductase n=1 Tax=Aureimonas sp. Leaf454 TaxID=1736381 RepID=UPI0007017A8F|nr:dihydrofolate reductase [Aureimonas sp. Leaf454]KQT46230.1 diacylglycerol kinase [Aureimonas sp. Leaf454]